MRKGWKMGGGKNCVGEKVGKRQPKRKEDDKKMQNQRVGKVCKGLWASVTFQDLPNPIVVGFCDPLSFKDLPNATTIGFPASLIF